MDRQQGGTVTGSNMGVQSDFDGGKQTGSHHKANTATCTVQVKVLFAQYKTFE